MISENSSSKGARRARGRKLAQSFYRRADALTLARELLGKRLVVPDAPTGARVSGRIVETEAYMGPEDKAAHSYANRRTPRTETMFAAGGVAYVYFIYGMYYQFNVVASRAEIPQAVLLRALEPEEGLEWMRRRRPVRRDLDLTNGPGKLCVALGLDRSFNGTDLRGERVWIEDAGVKIAPDEIAAGARIGIDYAAEYAAMPWRFWVRDNPYVSRKA
jgi:DNA-3-methyladenine glycosylase